MKIFSKDLVRGLMIFAQMIFQSFLGWILKTGPLKNLKVDWPEECRLVFTKELEIFFWTVFGHFG